MELNQTTTFIPLNTAMPQWGYIAATFALLSIGIFGLLLNFCAIMIMLKKKKVNICKLQIKTEKVVSPNFSLAVEFHSFYTKFLRCRLVDALTRMISEKFWNKN